MNDEMRIYVASLSDYNAGRLHGAWIDCAGKDADALGEEVAAMLKQSREPVAEEFAIHDHEGFAGLVGECTPLSEVAELVALREELGDEWPAYLAYAENLGMALGELPSVEDFRDAYLGEWSTLEDYAADYLEQSGTLEGVPDALRNYVDVEKFARDLVLGGDVFTSEAAGGVYVFYNH
ncbi:MAG: antirestriction protein ArdA [Schleiferiaceae bacterium]